jgi:putative FmdB family regulatory protein
MPIYEYECASCGKVTEILVRSRGDEGAVCPACGSEKLERMFSTFGVGKGSVDSSAPPCAEGGGCPPSG